MQHCSPFKSLLTIFIGAFFLQSCSTGYEASRFSHLKYVKKDHTNNLNDAQAQKKEDVKKLKSDQGTSFLEAPDNDYSASLDKLPSNKTSKQHTYAADNSKIFHSPLAEQFTHGKKSQSLANSAAQLKSFLKDDKLSFSKKESPGSLMYDKHKLLILWIALMSAALVFSIVGAYAPFIWIFATLAFVAGLVFFIFWLVAIASE